MLKAAIKTFPSIHKAAAKARWYFNRHISSAPLRLRTRRALRKRQSLAFDIGGAIGLGAILTHAAYALRVGRDGGVDIALCFTSPIYRPKNGPRDWLDSYFDRLGSKSEGKPVLSSEGLDFDYNTGRDHPLLWSYLQIRAEFMEQASTLTGCDPFAAIHYRGSDKCMEHRRVAEDQVLRRSEIEMKRDNLDRLFVASDEQSFIALARDRFGTAAFWLPCEAMSSDLNAAHFSGVDGKTKAREALVTMAVLSRATVCIRTPSFLSEWAATLSNMQRTILLS